MHEDIRKGVGVRGGVGLLVWGDQGNEAVMNGGPEEEPHLACCAVGHTGTPVAAQVEIGGTGTFVAAPRGQ